MKQEFVTLPREVVEQALEAWARGCPPDCKDGMTDSGGVQPWGEAALIECPSCQAVEALRAALDQPKNHVPDAGNMVPSGWKLVPVEPTRDMLINWIKADVVSNRTAPDLYRAMLAAAPQPPAPGCKATKRGDHVVCDDCKSAWDANDKNPPACVPAPPAVEQPTGGAREAFEAWCHLVGLMQQSHGIVSINSHTDTAWLAWQAAIANGQQPQGEQDSQASAAYDMIDRYLRNNLHDDDYSEYSAALDSIYTHPQPKREPLSDDDLCKVFPAIATYTEANKTLYRSIARAIEAAHNIK